MTWSQIAADNSLANGNCIICKKSKTAKEMGVAIIFTGSKANKKGLICRECFDRDCLLLSDIDEEQKTSCGKCFICDEEFNGSFDDEDQSYSFDIIELNKKSSGNSGMFCIHMHQECFEGAASEEYIYEF